MSNRIDRLSKIAQDEFGVTITLKPSTGETFDSLYGETKDCEKREKQIEEIAKAMCGGCTDGRECMHCLCADWYKAESVYNAGYRKQSEVAREIFDDIDVILAAHRISHFENLFDDRLTDEITKLKKKYTEE